MWTPAESEKMSPNGSEAPLNSTPRLYVITVNYHSEDHLKQLIGSLARVGLLKEMIIVDHSDSKSLDSLEAAFPVKIVRQANLGYGAGLNRGLREVPDEDAVAFLCNPDVRLTTPDVMEEVLAYLRDNPRIGCLFPSLTDSGHQLLYSCRKFYTPWTLLAVRIRYLRKRLPHSLREHYYMDAADDGPIEVDWGSGAGVFCRASLFPEHFRFDERFFLYFEDVDLCAHLWRTGFSVVKYPGLVFVHHAQERSRRELRFSLRHAISLLRFIVKYRGLPTRDDLRGHADRRGAGAESK